MIPTVFHVALGGAIGAAARYGVGVALFRPTGGFPFGVLAVNIIGSFLMGLLVVYLGQKMLTHLNPLLMTGVLGGFTTFSAFSLEAYTLFERGEAGLAALYVALSVILSIAALVLGIFIMRGVLA
ncbi:fluoride efflux transporter CrcB [Octadecabacter sp. 1_MG-2023]|uniref:fluoride efflux transporter CrcB n=1 Tax=unclassified Octadecabacter TaxID=196158 RepID=UPI001C08824B|nr:MULTISPECIES: fluoride efflux transporter CrcB [unclassified Octadecabacter]MBU2991636.1 fluoride efflux transporter CrcB [Octadecabacter sp. B2R22]MDO6736163.1 fluoride efflux transporter CrcB [Octadecabacter sp. 1_MG-2023]